MTTISPFIHILRISLGIEPSLLESRYTEDQWEEIAEISREQTVIGMIADAMMKLPERQRPPKLLKVTIALCAEQMGETCDLVNRQSRSIYDFFKTRGLRSCILKGQGTAALYPDPKMRLCGDIDIWIPGGYRHILEELHKYWSKTGQVFYHHVDIRPFKDKSVVEVHFTPTWMNNPFNNRRLQRWFEENQQRQLDNYDENLGFARPDIRFNCVYCAIHIYRHLLYEGIGLRQITDYYLILDNSTPQDRKEAAENLRRFGMKKFLPALMYVLHKVYCMPEEKLLVSPDAATGEFLLDEILKSGNFGHSDDRYPYDASKGPFMRAVMRMSRLRHYYCLAPSEVLWAPVFKLWQWSWKKIHKF